jgi:hypothetical protein
VITNSSETPYESEGFFIAPKILWTVILRGIMFDPKSTKKIWGLEFSPEMIPIVFDPCGSVVGQTLLTRRNDRFTFKKKIKIITRFVGYNKKSVIFVLNINHKHKHK